MSSQNSVLIATRDFIKRNFFDRAQTKSNQEGFIINLDDSAEDIFNKLISQKYAFTRLNPKAATASAGVTDQQDDPNYFYIEPRYNSQQLDLLEDAWINDLVINNGTNKFVYGIVGRHGKTVLDTKLEFNVEKDRRAEISKVNKDERNKKAKQFTDNVLESEFVDFFTNFTDMVEESLVFGRAASFITNDPITGVMESLTHLDPRRLGRVRVSRVTKQIDAVEYYDCIVDEVTGEIMIAIEGTNLQNQEIKPAWIPIQRLIYLPHAFGAVPKFAKYVGFSKIEGMVHMSQVKRIIMNESSKEGAKALYAGTGVMEFDPNTPVELMGEIVQNVKRAVGRWYGHKAGIVTKREIHDFKPAIDKFSLLVDMINREILRGIGIASFLIGYEQIANYANSEQIMLASKEMDIAHIRTRLKDFIRNKIINPIFYYFLTYGGDAVGLQVFSNNKAASMDRFDLVRPIKQTEMDEYIKRLEADKDVKLVYEFADLKFTTQLETAAMLEKVKGMVPALPSEAILRSLGLEDYVEEVATEEDRRQKMNEQIAQQGPPAGNNNMMTGGTQSGTVSAKEGTQPRRNIAAVASRFINQLDEGEKAELMELIRLQTKIYKQVEIASS